MKSKKVDFANDRVVRNIVSMMVPMLVAQLLNLLYNIVDRIYIGNIPGEGGIALGGIGLCFPIITIITAFANLFGLGGAPLFAIERGKGNQKNAQSIMCHAFVMLIATGILLTAAGMIFHKPILYLFGASDATYPYAGQYMMIYLIGTLFVMISLGMNPYINNQGFAQVGMLTTVLGSVLNFILDPVFIYVLKLGVRGAAIATVISQGVSAIWVLRFLTGRQAEYTLKFKEFKWRFSCVKNIVSLGIASFIMSCTNSFVQIACNSMLSHYGGDMYISIMTIINSIRQIVQTPVDAVCDGSSPVISYNYGAAKYKNVRRAIWFMTAAGLVYSVVIWVFVMVFPKIFVCMFNSDETLVANAVAAMHIYFSGFFMMTFQFAGQSVFKSLNKAKQAVFFSMLRKVIIVVPLTFILPRFLGVDGVFWAEPVSNYIGSTICFVTMLVTVYPTLKTKDTNE